MPQQSSRAWAEAERRLKLDTLTRLRWLAVAGQTASVLLVHYTLGFALPVAACLALIALSAALNLSLQLRFSPHLRLANLPATYLLGFDLVQLSGLLYLTGGLGNPFAMLLIAPMMVSATALPAPHTFGLGIATIVLATLLAFFHQPLPWRPGETFDPPILYLAGMWAAIVSALGFMGFYAARVTGEAHKLAAALAATELVLTREQHLTQLDGLAAAAAHELGTPLATIALVARELERETPPGSPHAEDIRLLRTQSDRCRDILRQIATLGAEGDGEFARAPITHLVEDVVAPHREFGVDIAVRARPLAGAEPLLRRNPGIQYGLGNIVENAVDFARTRVEIDVSWSADSVVIVIADDGPGFAPEVVAQLGEPYVTTRARGGGGFDVEAGGLGLGVFIAKTLLARSGAAVSYANRRTGGGGAAVTVRWPREALENGAAHALPAAGEAV